ncbi:MAG: GntR family transcriptional regulator [Candidatus Aminicenantes bacterium]|nr:MAG: GntR family transcriptional regulator [Candidatus Aminicenantes bacterium]
MDNLFIVVSHLNPDPMYKQITDQVKEAIASGALKPETPLLSIREMARELNISEITIKRAYSDLENEGLIITRPGMGSYVADINRDKIRQEKWHEIRKDILKILKTAERFDISAGEIIALVREIKESSDG